MGTAGLLLAERLSAGAEPAAGDSAAKSPTTGDSAAKSPATPRPRPRRSSKSGCRGGPPHTDTFDPKPESGSDYTGPLTGADETNVKGIRIGELLPELAKVADKYSIIRSMTHGVNGHETASYMVQTGRMPGGRLVYPAVGAVVTAFKGFAGGHRRA